MRTSQFNRFIYTCSDEHSKAKSGLQKLTGWTYLAGQNVTQLELERP